MNTYMQDSVTLPAEGDGASVETDAIGAGRPAPLEDNMLESYSASAFVHLALSSSVCCIRMTSP